jgi:hypothetical protein
MQLFGRRRPAQTTQLPTRSPEQQAFQAQLMQQAQQGLQDPTAGFEPIAQQAQERFRTQVAPGIAEQFAGLGATRSSAFPAALAGAGQQLTGDLAAQQAQFGQRNIGAMTRLAQLGLAPQFENVFQPEAPGQAQQIGADLFGAGLGGLGQLAGAHFQGQQQRRATSQAIKEWQDAQGAGQQQAQPQFQQPSPFGRPPFWSLLSGNLGQGGGF